MSEFVSVARVDEIPLDQGAAFAVNGRMVAIFRKGEEFFAIDDFCPHMGASLAGGHYEDGVVVCPWHAWRFDVCDGTWCDNPKVKTSAFEVRVEGEEILVRVPEPETPSGDVAAPAEE
ncbi:MAG: Rieske (2Fe-2S) protein [bacterium]|nr:Rieske (2Fe-2S) protein [bacterium]